MEKYDFIAACQTIIDVDRNYNRLNTVIREHDAEFGDQMFTYLPGHSFELRRLAIRLLARAVGIDWDNSIVEYYFDECLHMKNGGAVQHPNGVEFKLISLDDLWIAVSYEVEAASREANNGV